MPSILPYMLLVIYVALLGLGIYIAVLIIKALRVYIKNNS